MSSTLLIHGTEAYAQALAVTTEQLAAKDGGVYITTNRPANQLQERATFGDHVQFVDCISPIAGIHTAPPNTFLIDSPVLLEKIALRSTQILRRQKGARLLVLDNLSALSLYNTNHEVVGIVSSILTRCGSDGIDVLILVTAPGPDEITEKVSSLVDDVVTLS